MEINEILDPIHGFIWAASFFGLIISLFFVWKYDRKRGYIIGPLTYFLNVFFYNTALYLTYKLGMDILTYQQLDIWSGVVRLHSLFLLIGFIIFQPVRSKKDAIIDENIIKIEYDEKEVKT